MRVLVVLINVLFEKENYLRLFKDNFTFCNDNSIYLNEKIESY